MAITSFHWITLDVQGWDHPLVDSQRNASGCINANVPQMTRRWSHSGRLLRQRHHQLSSSSGLRDHSLGVHQSLVPQTCMQGPDK